MIVSLQSLTLQVETLGRLDAKEIPSRLYSISVACSDNFSESLHAYRQAGSVDTARQAVRLYHMQLLLLHQKLNGFCLDRNIEDRSALSALEELLERIEFLFKNDIDQGTILPNHYQHKIRTYVENHIHSIFDRLANKQIPQVYLDEILSAVNSLFEEGKIPYIQYHHQDYLIQFVDALHQLAKDDRSNKNWQFRFLVLMINFNFNHMGFFNRWKEMYMDDPSFMEGLLRFPKHFSCIRGFAYNNNSTSLLKLMCEYVQTETSRKHNLALDQTEQYLHSNFNGKELKIWMHLCVKAKITQSPEKKEVANEFSKLVKTREGTLLSPHSLTKMDKSAEYDAAVSVQRRLKAMLKELDDSFPDLNR
ncbi:hypothetical protein MUK51_17545 [Sphingobacterium faecium]|jgi:hypothetical protein|uniref:hypothetical protein n=1 Tax=Sphingobacterium faecium TaxID=34087 RepID=UPI0021B58BD1|nr:hypothetical protein [Sphingobacterium faecium]UXD68990.1 hypothetical protein MUK51_17545 [Sphingobacterium faecium]